MKSWDVRKQLMEREIDELRKEIIGGHKKCKGTGFVEKIIKDENGIGRKVVEMCSCKRRFELISTFLLSNIPYKSLLNQQIYGRIVIDSISKQKIEIRKEIIMPYIKNITKVAKNPYGLFFLGKNGVGKTFIGLKILYYATVNGFSVHSIEFGDFLKLSRRVFGKNGEESELLLNEISSVDVLMIDEIGNESKRSSYAISEFKSLYKKRVSLRKPTVLITNHSYDSFRKLYGKSIDNMVRSHSRIFDFSLAADVRTTKCNREMQTFFKDIKRK